MPAATVIGLASGALVWLIGRWLTPSSHREVQAEVRPGPAVIGGLTGGLSHPLLDAIMHSDVEPFWPLPIANPLLGLLDLEPLHLACLLTGLVGVVLLAARAHAARRLE